MPCGFLRRNDGRGCWGYGGGSPPTTWSTGCDRSWVLWRRWTARASAPRRHRPPPRPQWSTACVPPRISSCCSTTTVRSCRTPACRNSRHPTSPCSTSCGPSPRGRARRCTWSAGDRARAWSAGSADSRSDSMPTMASGRGRRARRPGCRASCLRWSGASGRSPSSSRPRPARRDRSSSTRPSRWRGTTGLRTSRRRGACWKRSRHRPLAAEPMTERVATEPFHFWTRLTLTKLTGRRAVDLAELVEHLRAVPLSVVFQHTHHFLVQHQYLSPEPPNDFAFWVTNVLQEDELGERLAAIDTVSFDHLRELRDRIMAVIEGYLEPRQALRTAPAGEEFHFMDAVSFLLPIRHRAASLAEFAEALGLVGGASIAYHLFESRLRNGGQENDFSRWLAGERGARELVAAVRGLDPYSYTADGLRHRLTGMITQRLRSRLEP